MGSTRPRRLHPVVDALEGERRSPFRVASAQSTAGRDQSGEVSVRPVLQCPAEDICVETAERQCVGTVQDDEVELRTGVDRVAHGWTIVRAALAGPVHGNRPGMLSLVELRPDYPLTTRRLRLRPLSADDTDDLVAYRSAEDVCRYVPFEPMGPAAVAEKLKAGWSRREIAAEGDAVTLGIELAGTGRLIGDVMLLLASAEHRRGEIGWVLHPEHSGRGYATEASHAVLHLAFDELGLHRVVARVDARNEASLRLGERLGMRREAYLVSNEWFKGAWSDEVDLALLDSEWDVQHAAGERSCAWPVAVPVTPGPGSCTGSAASAD